MACLSTVDIYTAITTASFALQHAGLGRQALPNAEEGVPLSHFEPFKVLHMKKHVRGPA